MQAGKRDEAKPLRDRVTAINDESKNLETQAEAQDAWVREFLLNLPNLPHESVPVGASSDDNPVAHTWGEAPRFDFPPQGPLGYRREPGHPGFRAGRQDHRRPLRPLKGAGARLERALINFMLDLHTEKHGYTEVLPPFMVNEDSLRPPASSPSFRRIYSSWKA